MSSAVTPELAVRHCSLSSLGRHPSTPQRARPGLQAPIGNSPHGFRKLPGPRLPPIALSYILAEAKRISVKKELEALHRLLSATEDNPGCGFGGEDGDRIAQAIQILAKTVSIRELNGWKKLAE